MFSLMFKKCPLRSQAREFATILVNSKNRINRKVIKHFTNVNCAGLMNRNDTTYYRPFSSTMDEIPFLPPLMNVPLYKFPTIRSFFDRIVCTAQIRKLIDQTFNMQEFMDGSKHAIMTISQALAESNYKELNGLVDEITIEMLKMKIDRLTMEQKQLIPITDKNLIWCSNFGMTIKDPRVAVGMNCQGLIEISQLGIYSCNPDVDFRDTKNFYKGIIENNDGVPILQLMMYNYTFQRCYSNEIGGPWIATVANHFTVTS